jgi:oxygen-independent coproporphyrinogen-3 oxidase
LICPVANFDPNIDVMETNLIQKYNVPGPRYTSYPTVPYWNSDFDQSVWERTFTTAYTAHKADGLSLYIHLPFAKACVRFAAATSASQKPSG